MIERHCYGVWDAELGWVNIQSSTIYNRFYDETFNFKYHLTEYIGVAKQLSTNATIIRTFDIWENP